MPIRVALFVCVYVEPALHGYYVERQQVVSRLRKQFHLIARLKDYLFRDHLKIQRHSESGFVLEAANYWVIFWRHGEGLILAVLCLIVSEIVLHRYFFNLEAHLVVEMNISDDGVPELVKQRLSIAVEVIQRR